MCVDFLGDICIPIWMMNDHCNSTVHTSEMENFLYQASRDEGIILYCKRRTREGLGKRLSTKTPLLADLQRYGGSDARATG